MPVSAGRCTRTLLTAAAVAGLLIAGAAPAAAQPPIPKVPVMTGTGGAVSSVDRDATQVGRDVLARGGNAMDAAVATAAALGVTEPYSAGIGGGGFLVYYDAQSRRVVAFDGRETAPATFTDTTLTNGAGAPLDFAATVSSGLSVGVPGTPATWAAVAARFGTRPLAALLEPAERLARDGFVVDTTFAAQTAANEARFRKFPETARVYLPGGAVPAVGSTFRNPDMARAYRVLRTRGVDALYRGELGAAVVAEARTPSTAPGVTVAGGQITTRDLRAYEVLRREPTRSAYEGLQVVGMPPPSSGGIAVGESLNLLESYGAITRTPTGKVDDVQYLHRFSEATATAFADRNRYVGDVPRVPVGELLRQEFADERACTLFDPAKAQPRPLPFGVPDGQYTGCAGTGGTQPAAPAEQGTTHLVTADRWGNVASYTLTIEQTGGSGITVPGWGFLLNNELTDFNFVPLQAGVPDPNLPGPGKRPRSSMSPTIVLDGGRPVLALGSPGGATIITTVTQVLTGFLDRGLALVDAIAAPRISSRNGAEQVEPAIDTGPLGAGLRGLGHTLTATPEIGAAAAVRILPGGRFEAAAEPTRRGGGSAAVVRPAG
jgi:gamma-glutamyltranspeptidase / glutathione hydrolase